MSLAATVVLPVDCCGGQAHGQTLDSIPRAAHVPGEENNYPFLGGAHLRRERMATVRHYWHLAAPLHVEFNLPFAIIARLLSTLVIVISAFAVNQIFVPETKTASKLDRLGP